MRSLPTPTFRQVLTPLPTGTSPPVISSTCRPSPHVRTLDVSTNHAPLPCWFVLSGPREETVQLTWVPSEPPPGLRDLRSARWPLPAVTLLVSWVSLRLLVQPNPHTECPLKRPGVSSQQKRQGSRQCWPSPQRRNNRSQAEAERPCLDDGPPKLLLASQCHPCALQWKRPSS